MMKGVGGRGGSCVYTLQPQGQGCFPPPLADTTLLIVVDGSLKHNNQLDDALCRIEEK